MVKRTDENIIRQLQSENEKLRREVLSYLYQVMQPVVKQFVLKNKGNEQDVDDVFHEGLIAFYKMVRQNKLGLDTNVEAYLYTICRNKWKMELKKRPPVVELTEAFHVVAIDELPFERIISDERRELLKNLLTEIGEDCRKLLHLFYYDRLRMKTIIKQMNFSNEQVARNKKLKCMKKLRSLILNSPAYKDILKNQ